MFRKGLEPFFQGGHPFGGCQAAHRETNGVADHRLLFGRLAAQITAPANAIGKILRGHMDTSIVEKGRAASGHRNRPARTPLSALSQHGSICRSQGRLLSDHLLLHAHAEVTRHRGEFLNTWKRGISILTNDGPKNKVPAGFDCHVLSPHRGAPVTGGRVKRSQRDQLPMTHD